MALKNYNPTTPSRRALVLVDKSEIYKGKPLKKLTKGLSKSGGRNNRGRITVWWRGGGHKRSYRIVDFKKSLTFFLFTLTQSLPFRTCQVMPQRHLIIRSKLCLVLVMESYRDLMSTDFEKVFGISPVRPVLRLLGKLPNALDRFITKNKKKALN